MPLLSFNNILISNYLWNETKEQQPQIQEGIQTHLHFLPDRHCPWPQNITARNIVILNQFCIHNNLHEPEIKMKLITNARSFSNLQTSYIVVVKDFTTTKQTSEYHSPKFSSLRFTSPKPVSFFTSFFFPPTKSKKSHTLKRSFPIS